MLKEGREKITPLEVPEWIQEAMLKEQAPWYERVALHTWILFGVGGFFLALSVVGSSEYLVFLEDISFSIELLITGENLKLFNKNFCTL